MAKKVIILGQGVNAKTLAQQFAIHGVVRSCYWCDEQITDKDEVEELPEGRGEAHKKCADEWYGSKMAEY